MSFRETAIRYHLVSDSKNRFMALDGLRGIAALFIVLLHITWPNHLTNTTIVSNGYLAVDLFFILSGFVIASKYSGVSDGSFRIRDFLYLRFFRVYPIHLIVLIVFVVLELVRLWGAASGVMIPSRPPFTENTSVPTLIANLLLVHSLGLFDHLSWNIPSWSISCEFAVYVLFGSGVLSLPFRNGIAFVAATITALFGYGILASVYGSLDLTYDLGIVRCVCGFFLGMAVNEVTKGSFGRILSGMRSTILSWIELLLLLALIIVLSRDPGWSIVLSIPIFVGLVTVLQSDRGGVGMVLRSPVAQFLGTISYSLYMVHTVLLTILSILLNRFMTSPMSAGTAVKSATMLISPLIGDFLLLGFVLIVVLFSAVTYSVVEYPIRSYGRHVVSSLPGRSNGGPVGRDLLQNTGG